MNTYPKFNDEWEMKFRRDEIIKASRLYDSSVKFLVTTCMGLIALAITQEIYGVMLITNFLVIMLGRKMYHWREEIAKNNAYCICFLENHRGTNRGAKSNFRAETIQYAYNNTSKTWCDDQREFVRLTVLIFRLVFALLTIPTIVLCQTTIGVIKKIRESGRFCAWEITKETLGLFWKSLCGCLARISDNFKSLKDLEVPLILLLNLGIILIQYPNQHNRNLEVAAAAAAKEEPVIGSGYLEVFTPQQMIIVAIGLTIIAGLFFWDKYSIRKTTHKWIKRFQDENLLNKYNDITGSKYIAFSRNKIELETERTFIDKIKQAILAVINLK